MNCRSNFPGLTAPERIARLASDKLGMMQPERARSSSSISRPEAPANPHRGGGEVRIARNMVPQESAVVAATSFRGRRIVVACGLVLAFVFVIVRLVNLQVMQAAELTVKADRQHQRM